ncbi:FixG Ig-like domain-containing protein, partial [Albidovulum sp.]|nr:FixG Ig-like domain-containing protein [Albidovulum sp.]
CALCIDACDEVMDRIGKPRGLIGYMALKDEAVERAGGHPKQLWKHILRPRTILYTTMWSAVGIALVVALFLRSPIDFNVTPERNPIFVTLSDGSIRNAYEVRLRNKQPEDRPFLLSITSDAPLSLSLEGRESYVVTVPADETLTQRVYVTAPPGSRAAVADRTAIRLWIVDQVNQDRVYANTVFNGKAD